MAGNFAILIKDNIFALIIIIDTKIEINIFFKTLFLDPNTRYYRAECEVPDHLICLGNRKFLKQLPCNWTGGYRWTTALALSITLGGFGADRYIFKFKIKTRL